MKQRILVAAASLVLSALILLLMPLGPTQGTKPTDPNGTIDIGGTGPNRPWPTDPEQPGQVRLYSCDETMLAVFDQLASNYRELTGVEVVVLRSGEAGCQATLQQYMETENAPTVLCIHNQSQLKAWEGELLDLQHTPLASALCNPSFGMWSNGKMLVVPMAVEGYGLLVNAELLAGVALTRSDITDFTSLATAVQILKDNSIKAFPTAQFTLQEAWGLLLDGHMETIRQVVDLYLANCNKTGETQELFLAGKAAFYLGGTWEYDALAAAESSGLHVRNLDILPIFVTGDMQYVCSSGWGINANARQVDVDATVDFLTWLVTAQDGAAPVDQLQMLSPFVSATWYGNQLEKRLRSYMVTEGVQLRWKDAGSKPNGVLLALEIYAEESTDENWNRLCAAVTQFKAENGFQ